MEKVEAYYSHQHKGWIVKLAETVLADTKEHAEYKASRLLRLYHAVQGFDSPYLDRLDALREDIVRWQAQVKELFEKGSK